MKCVCWRKMGGWEGAEQDGEWRDFIKSTSCIGFYGCIGVLVTGNRGRGRRGYQLIDSTTGVGKLWLDYAIVERQNKLEMTSADLPCSRTLLTSWLISFLLLFSGVIPLIYLITIIFLPSETLMILFSALLLLPILPNHLSLYNWK